MRTELFQVKGQLGKEDHKTAERWITTLEVAMRVIQREAPGERIAKGEDS